MDVEGKFITPPAPLDRWEHDRAGPNHTPSPVKGRAGEGLRHLSYDKRLTNLARENRKNPTPAKTILWNKVLRNRQFADLKFQRQKPIGRYVVDIYCAALMLVIEIDGDSHAEQITYDSNRTDFLHKRGIRVLRYTNHDVLHNLEGVFEDLSRHVEGHL